MEKRAFYRVPGLFVYEDGAKLERIVKGKNGYPDKYSNPKINVDNDGDKYININHNQLNVDFLVATCFCHRKPWQSYVIHLDNNKANCHKSNLKWGSLYDYCEHNTTDPKVVTPSGKRAVGNGYFISDKGEVEKDGTVVPTRDYIYDCDVDRHVPIFRFFEYNYTNSYGRGETQRLHLDEIVAKTFLPYPENLKDPVLLHKDHNYRNVEASNLEWVERDCVEYQEYLNQEKADKVKRQAELDEEFHFIR